MPVKIAVRAFFGYPATCRREQPPDGRLNRPAARIGSCPEVNDERSHLAAHAGRSARPGPATGAMRSASPPRGPPRVSPRRIARVGPAGTRPAKRVIVAGAGIGGLCCAYELMERGHDVTVLEASGRPGGHVKTIHDPLPDGLYADVGAEHFTRPGYEQYWKYVEKFGLPAVPYPRRVDMLRRIDGTWYTEAQLQDPKVLRVVRVQRQGGRLHRPPRLDRAAAPLLRAVPRRDRRRVPAVRRRARPARRDHGRRAAREGRRVGRRHPLQRPAPRRRHARPRATARSRPCSASGRRRS